MKILLGTLGTQEIIIIILFAFGLFLIPWIFFMITQQNTLKAIQPQNRTMPPGQVWLQLIPVFNLGWHFVVVIRISDSIRKELASENSFSFEQGQNYGNYNAGRPTYDMGIAYSVLYICGIIPGIGLFASLAGIICWIIYWVKLAEYKNKIEAKHFSATY